MSITQDPSVSQWWQSAIIDMKPGEIRYHGYDIEDLIGTTNFAQMIWLMLRGDLPTPEQATLLDACLMSAVDHGPQAPSIAIARMAATCGVGLNNAMASALNVLGDVHGGAGEQAVAFYHSIKARMDDGADLEQACVDQLEAFWQSGGKFIPGFGHRFHPIDPRAPRLMQLINEAAERQEISGNYGRIAQGVEQTLERIKGKKIPMNIDGATAAIYAELGFPAPLARGLFCLSRAVGILAHAWEQTQQGGRNKGPMPKEYIWEYTGHPPRNTVKS